ncbi:PA2169 family four-helix-bundle protein [Sphingopyxis kveilinensis]|uniref:PA2169 family four-helix-bundle protein n=1 Tax=Sphingopyxis kveilinensis TaxID=3114367 RepID=UPI0030D3F8C2
MFDNKNIATLNSLIATTLDSVDGYRAAADEANASQFREMFLSRASERQAVVADFQAKVRELGGNPEDDGTVLASAHRAWLGLRDALTGERDDKAVVAEVERGEDHIKSKFESALSETDLDPSVRQLIEVGYASVRAGHDQMSALKHGLAAD